MESGRSKPRLRPVIRVFVSSTFSDLRQERDALQRDVFPKLEQYCLQRQFQFQAIDLRWGVPSEAGFDHRTMRICFDELRRCQEVSPRPNFLVLLGDRYGWRPLPESLDVAEFRSLEEAAPEADKAQNAASAGTVPSLDALRMWYRLDKNADPWQYVLRSRRDAPAGDSRDYTTKEAWASVESALWRAINVAFPQTGLRDRFKHKQSPNSPPAQIIKFQASATEQEIWRGAMADPEAPDHVVAWFRTITNRDEFKDDPQIGEFFDLLPLPKSDNVPRQFDDTLHDAAQDLKSELRQRLPKPTEPDADHASVTLHRNPGGKGLEVSPTHIEAMCRTIETRLLEIIKKQIQDYWADERASDAPQPGVAAQPEPAATGPTDARALDLEIESHIRFGLERAPTTQFVGRKPELEAIAKYLENPAANSPLVVRGPSGTGKTALLARAAQTPLPANATQIVRFLGTTPSSTNIRGLLTSLCRQLRRRRPVESTIPTDLRELEQEFQDHLADATPDKPILLFLDALDQLEATDGGLTCYWLRTPLPPHVKLVVSCISGAEKDDAQGEPFRALQRRRLLEHAIAIDALSPDEALDLLGLWLKHAKPPRKLTDAQRQVIADKVRPEQAIECRRPLFLRILFEECYRWPSYKTVSPIDIGGNAIALLDALFDRLSNPAVHGKTVDTALAYISAARRGLSENEILEVLWADPDYRNALEAANQKYNHEFPPDAKHIPIAIWSRLRHDLDPYLSEHAAPGGSVLNFYHRQVGDAARRRFLASPATLESRRRGLARYFRISVVTNRQVDELPWHLAALEDWDALATLLADGMFLLGAWLLDQYDVRRYWARLESRSTRRITDAYKSITDCPNAQPVLVLAAVAELLEPAGYLNTALTLWEHIARKHRADNQASDLIPTLGNQADILIQLGRLGEAQEVAREMERTGKASGISHAEAAALNLLGRLYGRRGQLSDALASFAQAEAIDRAAGRPSGVQASIANQASIKYQMGRWKEALSLHQEEETICRRHGLFAALQRSLANQALIHESLADSTRALALLHTSEELCRDIGEIHGLHRAIGNQAQILLRQGQVDRAATLLREERRWCERLGDPLEDLFLLAGERELYERSGDTTNAIRVVRQSIELCERIDQGHEIPAHHARLASLYLVSANRSAAEAALTEAAAAAGHSTATLELLIRALDDNAQNFMHRGQFEEAGCLETFALRLAREEQSESGLLIALDGSARMLKETGRPSEALKLLDEMEPLTAQSKDVLIRTRCLGNRALLLREIAGHDRATLARAKALAEEQLALCETAGLANGAAFATGTLGLIARDQHDFDLAERMMDDQVKRYRDLDNKRELARATMNRATLAFERGDVDLARLLLGDVKRMAQLLGARPLLIQSEHFLASLSSLPAPTPRSAEELTALGIQASDLLAEEHFEEAERLFTEMMRGLSWGAPITPGVCNQRAFARTRMGKTAEAIDDLSAAIRHPLAEPDTRAVSLLQRAGLYGLLGDHNAALADLDAVLRTADAPVDCRMGALQDRSQVLRNTGDQDGAISDLRELVKLDSHHTPQLAQAFYERADARTRANNYPGAVADCETIASFGSDAGPWQGEATVLCGCAHAEMGMYDRAFACLSQALLIPTPRAGLRPSALAPRALVLEELGRGSEAIADLQAAIECSDAPPLLVLKARVDLGRLYAKSNRLPEAEGVLTVVADSKEDIPPKQRASALLHRAQVHEEGGQSTSAISDLTACIGIGAQHPNLVRSARIERLFIAKHLGLSVTVLEDLLALVDEKSIPPDKRAEFRLMLAHTYDAMGSEPEALRQFRIIARLTDAPESIRSLASAMMGPGCTIPETAESRAELQGVLEDLIRNPDTPASERERLHGWIAKLT